MKKICFVTRTGICTYNRIEMQYSANKFLTKRENIIICYRHNAAMFDTENMF